MLLALYQDDAESEESRPYINIFAVRADDVNNEVYKKCVEIYQTKPVLDALQEESGGTAVFADKFTTAQLQQYLTDIEIGFRVVLVEGLGGLEAGVGHVVVVDHARRQVA